MNSTGLVTYASDVDDAKPLPAARDAAQIRRFIDKFTRRQRTATLGRKKNVWAIRNMLLGMPISTSLMKK